MSSSSLLRSIVALLLAFCVILFAAGVLTTAMLVAGADVSPALSAKAALLGLNEIEFVIEL